LVAVRAVDPTALVAVRAVDPTVFVAVRAVDPTVFVAVRAVDPTDFVAVELTVSAALAARSRGAATFRPIRSDTPWVGRAAAPVIFVAVPLTREVAPRVTLLKRVP
jgi:hypothetical protein